ncbi:hypothetical protein NBRC116592_27930 [Colwellia sp. KU-HH00111]|uniref:hypothetical protein n=1 Tax=Colwellia sp. KU-HH00111 TaxID=3127652 RepID=UPI00310B8D27
MKNLILLIAAVFVFQGCAVGGKGGRDGGDASVEVGDVKPDIDTCVGTTVECNKDSKDN